MSEPETPLARWSRLKREAKREKSAEPPEAHAAAGSDRGPAATREEDPAEGPAFDPAALPPIESITAGTDIKGFLQAGVPAALTRAALRRVWTTDPAIRDFIGIAENQWDFTDPASIPGFGALQPSDDVGRLVSQAMGHLDDALEQGPAADRVATPASPSPVSLQRDTPVPQHEQAAAGVQASGIPERNLADTRVADRPREVNPADVAMQDRDLPAEGGGGPSRRSHGRALPQ